ncbi:hypothetical protein AB1Y20_014052 [Prymnesium parvum]|uniref:Cystathionine gamma-synthase n=1 Tax=Prymnesium parvum TaxID=97485 RepID=A0AB34IH25_PRYPA
MVSRLPALRLARRLCHQLPPPPPGSPTAAQHADAHTPSSTAFDVAPPLSLSTTFSASPSGHVYSRVSSPTRDRAEALLGAIESAPGVPAHAVLYSSGLAATFALLARLLPRRIAISGGYHGTHLAVEQLRRIAGGERFEAVPLPPPHGVGDALCEGDVIWLETPRNPDCHVSDIAAYAHAARTASALLVVDGTFAPPPLQRPLSLGAHAVMHSTTKSLSGHSDAVGGALCVQDASLAATLRHERAALGSSPGALEPWLLLRSLRTLHLRVARQSDSAAAVAAYLHAASHDASHPLYGKVGSVRHPSLPSDVGHAIATRQMVGGYGGCLAVELCSEAMARALPARLVYFRDATSLGGVESLIEWRRKYDDQVSPCLLRISVGLEDPHDLIEDLRRAILASPA